MNDPIKQFHIEQALQSNFRNVVLITELAELFLDLTKVMEAQHPAQPLLEKISYKMIEVLCQTNGTGRNLGGALTPGKAVPTCKKAQAKEILSLFGALSATLTDPPK